MLGISKLLKVSAVAVLKWVKKYADAIEEPKDKNKSQIISNREEKLFCIIFQAFSEKLRLLK